MPEKPVPDDCSAWLALWEAWLQDRGNDDLAATAGGYLLEILKDRGINPCGLQRPDRLRKQP